jgi:hypothetical protein
MEKSDQQDTEDRDLKELVTKLAISGETEQLKEILLQNKQLWNIKDWVRTLLHDLLPLLILLQPSLFS